MSNKVQTKERIHTRKYTHNNSRKIPHIIQSPQIDIQNKNRKQSYEKINKDIRCSIVVLVFYSQKLITVD